MRSLQCYVHGLQIRRKLYSTAANLAPFTSNSLQQRKMPGLAATIQSNMQYLPLRIPSSESFADSPVFTQQNKGIRNLGTQTPEAPLKIPASKFSPANSKLQFLQEDES